MAALIGAGLGLALAGLVVYWALVLSEGVYLGPRVVIWLYDRVAPRYDRLKNADPEDDSRYLARPLLLALDGHPAPRVLDVATGTGRLLRALLAEGEFAGQVAGIDRSRGMLAEAAKGLAGHGAAALACADAGHLPFPDQAFDAVACLEALEFTARPRETLREMARVLKPGGVLLVSNRVGWDALWYPGRLCGRGRLERELARLGLEVVESERWQVYYDLVWGRKRVPPRHNSCSGYLKSPAFCGNLATRRRMERIRMKKDLISLADLQPAEIQALLDQAADLKAEWQRGGNEPVLAGKVLGMIFQKPSLRTRVSFEMAMHHLGGHAMYLSPDEIGLGKRESVADVARVLSRYVDGIMARVFAHSHVVELARYSRVPVINGLSDFTHPCQGLADLFTIYEKKGRLQGLTLAYVGDANNVLNSLLFGGCKLGMRVVSANPPGYTPRPEVLEMARRFAAESGGSVEVMTDPHAAVRGADVIYTDVWTSMGQEAEREKRLQVFPPYQVNARLVSEAKPDVIVMHCLPAHRGEEITDEVADGPHSVVFDQAENRMHAQKAVLVSLMGSGSA